MNWTVPPSTLYHWDNQRESAEQEERPLRKLGGRGEKPLVEQRWKDGEGRVTSLLSSWCQQLLKPRQKMNNASGRLVSEVREIEEIEEIEERFEI